MKHVFTTFTAVFFCLFMSSSAFALASVCRSDSTSRNASHIVYMDWYESTITNILQVNSATSPAH